jgi:L,D-transpeptidase catalytic domain
MPSVKNLKTGAPAVCAMLLLSGVVASQASPGAAADPPSERYSRSGWASIGALNPEVFEMALGAASCAERGGDVSAPRTLTVIDYSRPSTSRRLWVYDLEKKTLLFEELVAHGSGSGGNVATTFSNLADSHQTSLGLFVTGQPYSGQNGYSLRLDGLDAGFNDRARERAIVIHGAPYVGDDIARAQGRLGRSWGCPAVRAGIARELIDTVRGGGLLFAYYPDPAWLAASRYLSCDTNKRR